MYGKVVMNTSIVSVVELHNGGRTPALPGADATGRQVHHRRGDWCQLWPPGGAGGVCVAESAAAVAVL